MTMTILLSNLKVSPFDDKLLRCKWKKNNRRERQEKKGKENGHSKLSWNCDSLGWHFSYGCISFHLIAFVRGAWNAISIFCLVGFQSCFRYWVSKMKMYFNNSNKKVKKRKMKRAERKTINSMLYKSTSKHPRQMLQFQKNVSFSLYLYILAPLYFTFQWHFHHPQRFNVSRSHNTTCCLNVEIMIYLLQ